MQIRDHFEITEVGDKFSLARHAGVNYANLQPLGRNDARLLERLTVLGGVMDRDGAATAVTALETLGDDQVWALEDEFLDRLAAATHLADE